MSDQIARFGEKSIRIRKGSVDSVDLYEVKEHELKILEEGEATGLYLNFSIFLLSCALSSIITLFTATFSSPRAENFFLFLSMIGVLGGVFLFILWLRGRKSIKSVIESIKKRIPQEVYEEHHTKVEINVPKDSQVIDIVESNDKSEND